MAVTVRDTHGQPQIDPNRIAAVVAGLMSLLTTVWAVEWIWVEGDNLYRWGVAVLFEALLIAFKSSLFNGSAKDDSLGWAGFIIDGVINAGGIVSRTGRVLTFPPIAALLTATGLMAPLSAQMAVLNGVPISWGGFILALIGGILLSVAPHFLWKRGG